MTIALRMGCSTLLCVSAASDYAANMGSVVPLPDGAVGDAGTCAEGQRCDELLGIPPTSFLGDGGILSDGGSSPPSTPAGWDAGTPHKLDDPEGQWLRELFERLAVGVPAVGTVEGHSESHIEVEAGGGGGDGGAGAEIAQLSCEDAVDESQLVALICSKETPPECDELRISCGTYRCDETGQQCSALCVTDAQCAGNATCQLSSCVVALDFL